MSLAGINSKISNPMHHSLACELAFNDCRDAQRRHRKAEWTKASNVCCVSVNSSWRRSPAERIEVSTADWSEREDLKTLRANILSSSRGLDKDLGVSLQSLITDQRCEHMTKPQKWCDRLRLFACLRTHVVDYSMDSAEITKLFEDSWPAALLAVGAVIKSDSWPKLRLVVKVTSFSVRYLEVESLESAQELYYVDGSNLNIRETMDVRMENCLVTVSKALANEALQHGFSNTKAA